MVGMNLPREAIEEFKEIYRKEFGEELPDDEASQKANNLIELFQIICQVERHEDGSAPAG
jgi:hypothetical protein